ncbi:hypothetical protein ACERK3_19100 [Phycisphaerales bacterium AB-hyl4]|uniref:Uncharacterized protein n=1 Tax=Natronomicrosphaera hydrolytica TaxID=3242702 RepID=A0ABV4UC38_9BACT
MHRAIVFVPAVSVLVHVGAGHFVYDVPFHVVHFSPVLLGLAVVVAVVMREREPACRFVFVLGLAALACAWMVPGSLVMDGLWPAEWTLSPLRIALTVAALIWMATAWRHRGGWLWLPAILSLGLATAGATPRDMVDRLSQWGAWLRDTPGSLLPASLLQWGMVMLGFAFFLLVVGGIVSLRKPASTSVHRRPGEES